MNPQFLALTLTGCLGLTTAVSASVVTVFDYDFEDGADQGGFTAVSTATLPGSGPEQGSFAGAEPFAFNGGGSNQFAPSGAGRNLGILNTAFDPSDVLDGEATLSANIRFEEQLGNDNMNLRLQVIFRLDDDSTTTRNIAVNYDQTAPVDTWFDLTGTIDVPANAVEVVRGFVQFGLFGGNNDVATSGTYYIDNFTLTYEQIPEPGSIALLGTGLLVVLARRRGATSGG